ncbi:Pex12 amino terminal region-domain-containing protein [Gautieria morchelliformis]|nr:Pex12 amino terminal region-domain-containing protein [Gautieria morchelliformis]
MAAFRLPPANQAQIIRANQRDLFHIASFREHLDVFLRTSFGTRWLLRWDKEVELLSKLAYFGLTTRYAAQSLGEEYTDIWPYSSKSLRLSRKVFSALILFSTLPPYLTSRLVPRLNESLAGSPLAVLSHLPTTLDILSEINLALFYFHGTYYDLGSRLLRIRHISTVQPNPNVTPPSYSLLGLMLAIRLTYRLIVSVRSLLSIDTSTSISKLGKRPMHRTSPEEPTIDARAVSSILATVSVDEGDTIPAEEDEHTALYISALSTEDRDTRRCTLCLEERTSTCATECGHLFCWTCIFGWGREKSECPLCRQSLTLARLLPIYNL